MAAKIKADFTVGVAPLQSVLHEWLEGYMEVDARSDKTKKILPEVFKKIMTVHRAGIICLRGCTEPFFSLCHRFKFYIAYHVIQILICACMKFSKIMNVPTVWGSIALLLRSTLVTAHSGAKVEALVAYTDLFKAYLTLHPNSKLPPKHTTNSILAEHAEHGPLFKPPAISSQAEVVSGCIRNTLLKYRELAKDEKKLAVIQRQVL